MRAGAAANTRFAAPDAAEAPGAWPPARQANYALAVCTAALMFNFLDRGILALLVQPIKTDLQLSDLQIGMIMGFAFVTFYAIVGLPIARLVDRYSRRLILGLGIAAWSGMTAACGLAHSFWQLFLARLGVGVGEACNGPATFSLLADLFPPAKLPRAFSLLNIGFMAGGGISLIVGGAVIDLVAGMPPFSLPVLGEVRPWQLVFFAVGLPGLGIAALMSTVLEPARRGIRDGTAVATALPVRSVIAYMIEQRAAYAPMFLGLALQGTLVVGAQVWMPTFFVREHGWTVGQFGLCFGLILLVISPIGLLLGSRLAERLARAGHHDANLRVVVIATAGSLPFMLAWPLVESPELAIVLLGAQSFLLALGPGPQNAAMQLITPNRMRGQITALFLFVFNILGFGCGPVLIALVSGMLGGERHVGDAIAVSTLVMEPLALVVFWFGLKPYGAVMRRTAQAA